jgi:ABC-2 type transport system permease protein
MRRRNLANIYDLGVKELWSLWRDPMMLVLIVYVFTASVYTKATSMPETLHNAPIAIVDEDNSALSQRVASAFYPPQFTPPAMIDYGDVDPGMDAGLYTFALVIPPNFQRDVLAGRSPAVQLNVDATRMSQAFTGSGYMFSRSPPVKSTSSSSVIAAPPRHPWIWPCARASTPPSTRPGSARWCRSSTTSRCCPSS